MFVRKLYKQRQRNLGTRAKSPGALSHYEEKQMNHRLQRNCLYYKIHHDKKKPIEFESAKYKKWLPMNNSYSIH